MKLNPITREIKAEARPLRVKYTIEISDIYYTDDFSQSLECYLINESRKEKLKKIFSF